MERAGRGLHPGQPGAPGGRYEDLPSGGKLSGESLQAYEERLWDAFPELNFPLVSAGQILSGETGHGEVPTPEVANRKHGEAKRLFFGGALARDGVTSA